MKPENIIYTDDFEAIGFYRDLKALVKKQTLEYVEQDNFEEAEELADFLQDIYKFKDYAGLLIASQNNGMGWTIKEYKETQDEH